MQVMHADNMKISLYILFFVFFFSTLNANAELNFYKCPEKINTLNVDQNNFLKSSIEGENIIKLDNLKDNTYVDIYFKNFSDDSISELIINKKANLTTLGFDIENKINNDELSRESFFSFIEVGNIYAFTRKEFYWRPGEYNENEVKYDYNSSGRCERINQSNFYKLIKKTNFSENQITSESKAENKLENNSINKLSGERTFALSWEGYNDLILGSLIFDEKNLVGNINFDLPNKDGSCFGTYALSRNKGTWSIRCDTNDMNGSGFLTWNSNDGSVTGTGKDNNNKNIKFKIGSD